MPKSRKAKQWRLAGALVELRAEVDARWPHRDRSSDGTIGDTSHAGGPSDHNPNAAGVVCALDIDVDLDGSNDSHDPADMGVLTERLRASRDPRLKYVIWRGLIFSSYPVSGHPAWDWRLYHGADFHSSHCHVSVGHGPDGQSTGNYDDSASWGIDAPQPTPAPPDDDMEDIMTIITVRGQAGQYLGRGGLVFPLDQPNDAKWAKSLVDSGQAIYREVDAEWLASKLA